MSTTPEPTSTSSAPTPISSSTSMPVNASDTSTTPAPTSNQDTKAIPSTITTDPTSPTRPTPLTTHHHSSDTIIIPRDDLPTTPARIDYSPSDARAMSPRRNSAETDKISEEMRETQLHARNLQGGLIAIAEKIDTIKADHERLEKQNVALQDYIGGLTRSMSRTDQGGKK